MNWFRRLRARRLLAHEAEFLESLRDAPDDAKEKALRKRTKQTKSVLDPGLIAEIETASDEETEAGIAEEIRKIKRADPQRWKQILAALPKENQDQLREIERRYGV